MLKGWDTARYQGGGCRPTGTEKYYGVLLKHNFLVYTMSACRPIMHSFGLCGCAPPAVDESPVCEQCDDDAEPVAPRPSSPSSPVPPTVAPLAKRQKVEQYPPLPVSTSHRVKGTIYRVSDGVHKKWNGRFLSLMCGVCNRLQASYPDETGRGKQLCAGCAREAGTYTVRSPCRDCPDDAKLQAHYPDETGRGNRLCATHAREAGAYTVLNPCRDCPDDAKKEAGYPDETGRGNRLCAGCARKAGAYTVRSPCRDCPDDAKKQANYPDETGRGNQLCAGCAFEAGLKPMAAAGASMAACECWHRLEHVSTMKLTHHIHFANGNTNTIGTEKTGLIPGRRFKPDAFVEPGLPIHLPGETSGTKGAVYLYHGNEWHGYPPQHPKHEGTNLHDTPYMDLYQRTLDMQQRYKAEGYRVFVVWEHEYRTTTRSRCPAHILSVVREV